MSPDEFLQMLAPAPGEKILDVGAGKGEVAGRVMGASKGAEVYAVEPDEKRLAAMKRDFPAVKCSMAGAESLPFPDSYFDKVYATMALHHFADLDAALRQVARVLKHGGAFVILEVEPRSTMGRVFRFFGRLTGEHMNMMTEERCLEKLRTAGDLEVVASVSLGARYLVRLKRL